jgi:hypothetical protein
MGWGFGIQDPEKNLFRIPDPGQGSKKHRIPDPDPQHCIILLFFLLFFNKNIFHWFAWSQLAFSAGAFKTQPNLLKKFSRAKFDNMQGGRENENDDFPVQTNFLNEKF